MSRSGDASQRCHFALWALKWEFRCISVRFNFSLGGQAHKKCKCWSLDTSKWLLGHLKQTLFWGAFAVFGIFDLQKMQILVNGHIQMTCEGIWDKIFFLHILAFLTTKLGILTLQICKCWKFWWWETPNDFGGYLEQTNLLPMLAFLIPQMSILDPHICIFWSWETQKWRLGEFGSKIFFCCKFGNF